VGIQNHAQMPFVFENLALDSLCGRVTKIRVSYRITQGFGEFTDKSQILPTHPVVCRVIDRHHALEQHVQKVARVAVERCRCAIAESIQQFIGWGAAREYVERLGCALPRVAYKMPLKRRCRYGHIVTGLCNIDAEIIEELRLRPTRLRVSLQQAGPRPDFPVELDFPGWV
jgi:hypothetical protein